MEKGGHYCGFRINLFPIYDTATGGKDSVWGGIGGKEKVKINRWLWGCP
jgi:hypothetical protein